MGKRGVGKEMRWMCGDAWGGGRGTTWRFGWSMRREGTHYGAFVVRTLRTFSALSGGLAK